MKCYKYQILVVFMLYLVKGYAQVEVYSNDFNINIELDFKTKNFKIYGQVPTSRYKIDDLHSKLLFHDHGEMIILFDPFSEGNFSTNMNEISCYDPKKNRIYKFNIIDQYTLQSTKTTAVFRKGELLKIKDRIDNKKGIYDVMIWKNKLKHGVWSTLLNDSIVKLILYKNDELVDSLFVNTNIIEQ